MPYLMTENLKNLTLFGSTYLYSPYMGNTSLLPGLTANHKNSNPCLGLLHQVESEAYHLGDKLLVEFMKCFSCAQLVKVRCMTTFDPTNEVLRSINSHIVHMHRKLFFGKKIKNI